MIINSIKIISVVGARPNFMKIAPFIKAIEEFNSKSSDIYIDHTLVHTGQHYDEKMSGSFFKELQIDQPDVNLEIGSGTHAEQVGNTMIAFEKVLKNLKPHWVVVVGDVNATCACSITTKKEGIRLAHIEAGLRSYDIAMPEEINRLVTDRLSDLLLTPDSISSNNLQDEGVDERKIKLVGNIMIDTLETNITEAKKLSTESVVKSSMLAEQQIPESVMNGSQFGLVTMHRPSNVDNPKVLREIVTFLAEEATSKLDLIWPIHPRTKNIIAKIGLLEDILKNPKLLLTEPLGYLQMLKLNMSADIMLTDSGGLQEECCVLGTPCLTMRWNTERPITLKEHGGASVLVGNSVSNIRREFLRCIAQDRKPKRPKLWDGNTAKRIVNCIVSEHLQTEEVCFEFEEESKFKAV
ncbi:UDP-N-acetylglucosamine 2-epimerase (non-hydrolyzing) [Chitinispirillales bacterium ANBcel5]|uniref:non-hydrolyzing UDP-N-acetylglucosamine 2-epimerase n=1 Tax=Cellulosispirillum alkaliphilum TaxID=3039283 RepID=UPI002A588695|nr:UDP-N-acetylglucosamine 2-epimerase (non-hydrolyzing) [Chitinispirillales bacterium ANBcel5]